ncbi:MAG TPA: PQQ-binding-like beta-propeller repeat protein [Pirellulales bacterium]|jgi:WD40 repeat protein|nr:PQQ-binding-like beta-propeller repeat protein [Pirellulales bacterium]
MNALNLCKTLKVLIVLALIMFTKKYASAEVLGDESIDGAESKIARPAFAIAYSADGKLLIVGVQKWTNTQAVTTWDVHTHEQISFIPRQQIDRSHLLGGLRSPETKAIRFTVVMEATDVVTGQKVQYDLGLHPNMTPLKFERFNSTGDLLAAIDKEQQIHVFDLKDRRELLSRLPPPRSYIQDLTFSKSGDFLYCVGEKEAGESKPGFVRAWKLKEREPSWSLDAQEQRCLRIKISTDDTLIALGTGDRLFQAGELKLLDSQTGKERLKKSLSAAATSVAFSLDGRFIFVGDSKGGLFAWKIQTGALVFELHDEKSGINDISCSPDGRSIATAADDGSVTIRSIETGKIVDHIVTSSAKIEFGDKSDKNQRETKEE